jgi:hypothetical protein
LLRRLLSIQLPLFTPLFIANRPVPTLAHAQYTNTNRSCPGQIRHNQINCLVFRGFNRGIFRAPRHGIRPKFVNVWL